MHANSASRLLGHRLLHLSKHAESAESVEAFANLAELAELAELTGLVDLERMGGGPVVVVQQHTAYGDECYDERFI